MAHDFEAQRRETFDSFAEMKKGGATLPQMSLVEFYLLAESDEANWKVCEKALQAKGVFHPAGHGRRHADRHHQDPVAHHPRGGVGGRAQGE